MPNSTDRVGAGKVFQTAVEAFKDGFREGVHAAKAFGQQRDVGKVDLRQPLTMDSDEGLSGGPEDKSLQSRKSLAEAVKDAFHKSHEAPTPPPIESFHAWMSERASQRYMPTKNPLYEGPSDSDKALEREDEYLRFKTAQAKSKAHEKIKETVRDKFGYTAPSPSNASNRVYGDELDSRIFEDAKSRLRGDAEHKLAGRGQSTTYEPGESNPKDFVFTYNPETGETVATSKKHYQMEQEARKSTEERSNKTLLKGTGSAKRAGKYKTNMPEQLRTGEFNPFKHKQLMQELKNQSLREQASAYKVDSDENGYVQQYEGENVTDRQMSNIKRMQQEQADFDKGLVNLQYQAELEAKGDEIDAAQAKLDQLNQKKTRLEKFIGILERAVARLNRTRAAGLFKGYQDTADRVINSLSMLSNRLHERSKLVKRKIPAQETVVAALHQEFHDLLNRGTRAEVQNWELFEEAGFGYGAKLGSMELSEVEGEREAEELAREEAELDELLSDMTPLLDDLPEVKTIVVQARNELGPILEDKLEDMPSSLYKDGVAMMKDMDTLREGERTPGYTPLANPLAGNTGSITMSRPDSGDGEAETEL